MFEKFSVAALLLYADFCRGCVIPRFNFYAFFRPTLSRSESRDLYHSIVVFQIPSYISIDIKMQNQWCKVSMRKRSER
jgi:hypothetical protein